MKSLSNWFRPGQRRDDEAEEKLRACYRSVFKGKPTKAEQEVVLSDLCAFSGVHTLAAADDNLIQREGRRSVGYRVLRYLELEEAERTALMQAVVMETLISDAEGDL